MTKTYENDGEYLRDRLAEILADIDFTRKDIRFSAYINDFGRQCCDAEWGLVIPWGICGDAVDDSHTEAELVASIKSGFPCSIQGWAISQFDVGSIAYARDGIHVCLTFRCVEEG